MHIQLFKDSDRAEKFAAGSTIFAEGDLPCGEICVVVESDVDIFVDGQHIDKIGPDTSLGEVGLVDQGPRTATAVARTDCRLEPIDKRRFAFMVQQTPYFAPEMLEILAKRVRNQREG